jgi:hypothetical protein
MTPVANFSVSLRQARLEKREAIKPDQKNRSDDSRLRIVSKIKLLTGKTRDGLESTAPLAGDGLTIHFCDVFLPVFLLDNASACALLMRDGCGLKCSKSVASETPVREDGT